MIDAQAYAALPDFHDFSISSSVRPLVSGTAVKTKTNVNKLTKPYIQKVNTGPMAGLSLSEGNVKATM